MPQVHQREGLQPRIFGTHGSDVYGNIVQIGQISRLAPEIDDYMRLSFENNCT